jgi:lipoyl(octanoyl) transferase
MREEWLVLHSPPDSAAANMALDELLLFHSASLGRPVLRFYAWSEPAASFGYFQKIQEVERWTSLRPLVRRPTGGGLVPHENDWTYTIMVPPGHEWHRLKGGETYRLVHEWLRSAFLLLGKETSVAAAERKETEGCCFRGWERFDLLFAKSKIAGAAQKRSRAGLLIQGSVQPQPLQIPRADLEMAMLKLLIQKGAEWKNFFLPQSWQNEWRHLAQAKYGAESYTRKR